MSHPSLPIKSHPPFKSRPCQVSSQYWRSRPPSGLVLVHLQVVRSRRCPSPAIMRVAPLGSSRPPCVGRPFRFIILMSLWLFLPLCHLTLHSSLCCLVSHPRKISLPGHSMPYPYSPFSSVSCTLLQNHPPLSPPSPLSARTLPHSMMLHSSPPTLSHPSPYPLAASPLATTRFAPDGWGGGRGSGAADSAAWGRRVSGGRTGRGDAAG